MRCGPFFAVAVAMIFPLPDDVDAELRHTPSRAMRAAGDGTVTEARRWLILGPGGAGKSTLADAMGRILHLPLIHLDRHYWRPGWIEPAAEEWDRKVAGLVAGEEWIMDGNYSRTLPLRLPRAEAVVLLDPPPLQCLWGVFRRGVFAGAERRPDLADGCEEKFPDRQFLRYVATYRRRSRPRVLRLIERARHVRLHHLRSRREAARFLAGLAG